MVARTSDVLPKIELKDGEVICDGCAIDLRNSPLTLKLFEIFLKTPDAAYTRSELIALIYRDTFGQLRSDRYRRSLAQNIVKLISRARSLADEAVNRTEKWIDWFVYQPESGRWCFYQITPHYFSRLENRSMS